MACVEACACDRTPHMMQPAVELEETLINTSREKMAVDQWCQCNKCVTMDVPRECLCCEEIVEVKESKSNMSKN